MLEWRRGLFEQAPLRCINGCEIFDVPLTYKVFSTLKSSTRIIIGYQVLSALDPLKLSMFYQVQAFMIPGQIMDKAIFIDCNSKGY